MHPLLPALLLLGPTAPPEPAKVDFNRDVRPILADHCYQCHGPDAGKRKADLRLDLDPTAQKREQAVVVAGKPAASELIRRVAAADATDRMPPAKFARPLTREAGRNADGVGRARREVGETLGADSARAARTAGHETPDPQRDRQLHLRAAREGRTCPERGSRPRHAHPPHDLRPDRPPAHAGGGRCVRERPVAGRRTRVSWTGCSRRRGTASAWRGGGSTPPATPTRTATRPTASGRCGGGATG